MLKLLPRTKSEALTPQERFERAQRAAIPEGDLSAYEGMWIAVRDSHVVASNADLVALYCDPAVSPDDALMAIPVDEQDVLMV
jgi:hypothetical protein